MIWSNDLHYPTLSMFTFSILEHLLCYTGLDKYYSDVFVILFYVGVDGVDGDDSNFDDNALIHCITFMFLSCK